jgi:hypothetical protein
MFLLNIMTFTYLQTLSFDEAEWRHMCTMLSQSCECAAVWCGDTCCSVNCWTSACVREHNDKTSDVPFNDGEQLYCIVQQCQIKCLCFRRYASWLFCSLVFKSDMSWAGMVTPAQCSLGV